MRRYLVAPIAILAFTSLLSAQQNKVLAPHRPIPQRINKKIDWSKKATQRSMIGGLWMTDANFKSSIYLRSVVESDPITVTPILWLANGTKYTLPNVTLEPAGTAIIDINAGLQSKGISSWATLNGYVELQYTWPWDPLCATIRDIDVTHSLIFTFGMRATTPLNPQAASPATAQSSTQMLEGMWWKEEKNVTGFVALANTSAQPVQASMQVGDQLANALAEHNVTISPHGMKLVNLPELPDLPASVGGIHISYTGPTDALIVNGGVEDESVGYSAGLAFSSPQLQAEQLPPYAKLTEFTSVAELGLMTGAADPMMKFPAGTTFTPYSVLRNISDAPLSLTPTIWWMQDGQARSSPLQPIQLLPNQSQALNVPVMLFQAGLSGYNGTFNLVFNGNLKRGSLLTAAGSVDQTKTYVFEVTPRGVAESASKSMQYWSTGNGDDTMITLWNPADEAQDLIFKLLFTGGHYLVPLHLEPRATRIINVSDITMNPAPDAEGNTIPPSIHEGSIKITGSDADNEIILLSIDAGVYNVRKATCGLVCYTCDGYSDFAAEDDPFSVDITFQYGLTLSAAYDDGWRYNFGGTWNSNNTSVATVASSSGMTTGMGTGSVTMSAEVADAAQAPVYAPDVCTQGGYDPCPIAFGGGASSTGTVYDPTPEITSISGQPWPAGATNYPFTIYGNGFGTNPSLTITGAGITSYGIVGTDTDTQIDASVTIAASTPTESVTVTVTSNGFNYSGFIGASGQPSQGSANASVAAIAAPAPQIWFNGSNITGTTQSVVVGQQIALSTVSNIPSGVVITSNAWNISGTVVGGYNASPSGGSVIVPTFTGSSTTIYWSYPGQNLSAQYSYCLNNGQCSPTATATFNVAGPTVSSMSDPTGSVGIFSGPVLGFGPVGIKFNPTLTIPSGDSGQFEWVQLITNDTLTLTTTGGTVKTCVNVTQPATSSGTGLDTLYPYATGTSTQDSPNTALNASSYSQEARSFSAQMYVLWDPALPAGCTPGSSCTSIPVSLGSVSWGWSGTAAYSSGNWSLISSSKTSPAWTAGNSYPTWSDLVPYNGTISCH